MKTPHEVNEERRRKIEAGARDFAERFEGVMKDLAKDETTKDVIEEGVTEFWKTFRCCSF